MENKRKIGFGIIGCGMISKWHAEAICAADEARLVGVADVDHDRAVKFSEKYGCIAFSDVDSLIKHKDIDVVCICVPSGLHSEYAVKAARAGKHFVVEKPLAINREQLKTVIDACEENRVKGCVISQLRFSPSVQKVKKAIDDGALGKLLFADLTMKYYRSPDYYSSVGWRGTREMDGGGALMNQGIHGIDLIQYLAGPICSVSGICKTLVHDIEVEDTASLTVEFENGAIGTITGATSAFPGFPRYIEINGTKGSIALTEDKIAFWSVDGEEMGSELDVNVTDSSSHDDPTQISFELHKKQIADMIDALKNDRAPLVDVYEGKRAVEVILSAYEADEKERKIVV